MDRRAVRAWYLYDWANSAFATTVMAAMFPPFFRGLATASGMAGNVATATWGYVTATALLLVALSGPLLGAIADQGGRRKIWLAASAAIGCLATAAFTIPSGGAWRAAAVLYVVANLGFAVSIVFYESFLPHLAPADRLDGISARGYATGYAGGGLLLAVNVLWVLRPGWFGLPGADAAVRLSFLSVAVWWAVFSLPLLRRVAEPPASGVGAGPLDGFRRLRRTFRQIRRHRHLAVFLVAYWIYNDGIGTIIKMATAYGDEIGIALGDLVGALLLTQVVAVPCSILFGRLAGRIGAKRSIQAALAVYAVICALGFLMRTALHFYLLALLVGTVQGGAQSLSRSLFGAMVPRTRSTEFFGFYSTSGRLAGVAGPLVFGVVSEATGHSRLAILVLIVFFAAGAWLLERVDVAAGIAAARAEEASGVGGGTRG